MVTEGRGKPSIGWEATVKGSERKHRVKMDIEASGPKSQEKLLRVGIRGTKNYDRLFSTKIISETNT